MNRTQIINRKGVKSAVDKVGRMDDGRIGKSKRNGKTKGKKKTKGKEKKEKEKHSKKAPLLKLVLEKTEKKNLKSS
jgi:hypothetical protein